VCVCVCVRVCVCACVRVCVCDARLLSCMLFVFILFILCSAYATFWCQGL
jgi:hypothetical protein